MKLIPKHPYNIINGKLTLKNDELFRKDVLSRGDKEGFLVLKNKTNRKMKSHAQLKYYWGVIIKLLCKRTGYSKDMMHAVLGQKFLMVYQENGLHYIESTAMHLWSTVRWESYCTRIREWAWDFFEERIPLPNEIDYDNIPDYHFK